MSVRVWLVENVNVWVWGKSFVPRALDQEDKDTYVHGLSLSKGGTGKTTLASNVAALRALRGQNVIISARYTHETF